MNKTCFLCKSDEDDELLYGKFYTKWTLSVHYYCLLVSSNLVQNGEDDEEGIFGFLEADIRRENKRTKNCRCFICKQMHANVFCCAKKCLRTFHTVCGVKNRCLTHYINTFQSWCSAHVPLETDRNPHVAKEPCSICYDDMGAYDRINSIRAPCCKNGWYHRQCVARFAQTAGYFFKCPLCNNVDTFKQEVPLRGVFVPERDAAWELEPNAFQEQLVRPSACDAEECKCEEGREAEFGDWSLLICGTCGSTCRHQQCMEMTESRAYVCQLCRPIIGVDMPALGTLDDDDNDADNDTTSTVSSSSFYRAKDDEERRVEDDESVRILGSDESGVHCSDEALSKPRRLRKRRGVICSPDSDSEKSESSLFVTRRCLVRNTRKRVRRPIIEDSDGTGNEDERRKTKKTGDCVDLRTAISCQATTSGSTDEQMDENSDTSGTSSISIEIVRNVRLPDSSSQRQMIESSENSDKQQAVSTHKVKRHRSTSIEKPLSNSLANIDGSRLNESPSSDDSASLSKRHCVMKHSDRETRTVNLCNTSNEENISPTNQKNKLMTPTTPTQPSNATAHEHDKSGEAAGSQCRLQQSILKFFSQSPRYSPPEASGTDFRSIVPSNINSTTSSSSNPSSAKRKVPRHRKASKSPCTTEENKGKRLARRTQISVAYTEDGQQNLLNYFNRC